jgi:ADP-heptose:LPS heptosyltransferase
MVKELLKLPIPLWNGEELSGRHIVTLSGLILPGEDFDNGPDAFIDTAAIMQILDLIVTCDTSIAHLAGALGRPVWVLLKDVPDWRWLLERQDSPWYPTMRLFRQKRHGGWGEVFDRVSEALEPRAREGRRPFDFLAATL